MRVRARLIKGVKVNHRRPLMQLLQRFHGRVPRTPGRGVPGMRFREKKATNEELERSADFLEEDDYQD